MRAGVLDEVQRDPSSVISISSIDNDSNYVCTYIYIYIYIYICMHVCVYRERYRCITKYSVTCYNMYVYIHIYIYIYIYM